TRMTIIRLAKGGLLVHSPVELDAELRHSIDALGETRVIIAPNKLHHLFVQDYIAAYPKARVYAAPGLPQKRPDLRFDDILSDTPQVEWRGQVEQSDEIATVLYALGCRALWTASIYAHPGYSRLGGRAKLGREDSAVGIRPHNREPRGCT